MRSGVLSGVLVALAVLALLAVPAPAMAAPDTGDLLSRQATSAAELQAQIDLQLRVAPGGKQTAPNEVSYNDGKFVVTFAPPGARLAGVADCPSGWYCFYDYTNYGYPRGKLSDPGAQYLVIWNWQNRTESVHNNTSTYVEFLDNNAYLFCMEAGAVSSDVNPWRNQADWVYRGENATFC